MVYFLMIVSPQGFNSSIQVSGERSDIDNNIIVQSMYLCYSHIRGNQ